MATTINRTTYAGVPVMVPVTVPFEDP